MSRSLDVAGKFTNFPLVNTCTRLNKGGENRGIKDTGLEGERQGGRGGRVV